MKDCFLPSAKEKPRPGVNQGESTGKVFSIARKGGGGRSVAMGCQEGHTAGHRTELGSLASQEDPRDPTPPPLPQLYPEWHPAFSRAPAGQARRLFVWDPIVIWAPVGRSQLSRLHSARLK